MENLKGSNADSAYGDGISLSTPTDPNKMELMASQTETLHKMSQPMENVQQAVSVEAPLINSELSVFNTNHEVSLKSPPQLSNKEKLLVMQAHDLQRRMQRKVSNNQRFKRSRETLNLEEEQQHKNIKALGKCQL